MNKGAHISGGQPISEEVVKSGEYECASRCASTSGCKGWELSFSHSKCRLKDIYNSNGPSDDYISGTKECGSSGNHQSGLLIP